MLVDRSLRFVASEPAHIGSVWAHFRQFGPLIDLCYRDNDHALAANRLHGFVMFALPKDAEAALKAPPFISVQGIPVPLHVERSPYRFLNSYGTFHAVLLTLAGAKSSIGRTLSRAVMEDAEARARSHAKVVLAKSRVDSVPALSQVLFTAGDVSSACIRVQLLEQLQDLLQTDLEFSKGKSLGSSSKQTRVVTLQPADQCLVQVELREKSITYREIVTNEHGAWRRQFLLKDASVSCSPSHTFPRNSIAQSSDLRPSITRAALLTAIKELQKEEAEYRVGVRTYTSFLHSGSGVVWKRQGEGRLIPEGLVRDATAANLLCDVEKRLSAMSKNSAAPHVMSYVESAATAAADMFAHRPLAYEDGLAQINEETNTLERSIESVSSTYDEAKERLQAEVIPQKRKQLEDLRKVMAVLENTKIEQDSMRHVVKKRIDQLNHELSTVRVTRGKCLFPSLLREKLASVEATLAARLEEVEKAKQSGVREEREKSPLTTMVVVSKGVFTAADLVRNRERELELTKRAREIAKNERRMNAEDAQLEKKMESVRLTTALTACQSETKAVQEKLISLRAELNEMKNSMDISGDAGSDEASRVDVLKRDVAKFEEAFAKAEASIFSARCPDLQVETILPEKLGLLITAMDVLEKSVATRTSEVSKLTETVPAIEASLAEKDAAVKEAEQKLAQIASSFELSKAEKESQLSQLRDVISQLPSQS